MDINPKEMRAGTRLKFCGSVRLRDEDRIAFESQTGCIAELNDLGFVLMKAIQDKLSVGEISTALGNHLKVERNILNSDIIEFYSSMLERGFLTFEQE